MTLEKERRFLGIFAKHLDAELALQELKATDFPMHKVSVIARNVKEQGDIPSVEVKKPTSNTSHQGALGGLTSLLVGLGVLTIADINPVTVPELEETTIATTLAGSAIAVTAGTLVGALLGLGIPEEQAHGYSDLVSKGYYLVIVTGIDIEIRLVERIFNRRCVQQSAIYQICSSQNRRYKHGVGVFYARQDIEAALTELRTAGFPMSQVSVVAKDISTLNGLSGLDISNSKHNYTTLGIPDDLARHYEDQVKLGNYVVVLNGTDIYIAGARAILESNKIQHFRIYSQPTSNANRTDRYVMNTNLYF
ncbi:hypothetical protein [Nostoc sp.]|uniref:hypothetical protein n=1 Tax=Nostoc sp. TaxID=1180 RepID=UPI0035939721